MSVKSESLNRIRKKIREIQRQESEKLHGRNKLILKLQKWFYLLSHEVIKDDVRVRAESMAYLTIFSVLPLVAGFFFLVSLFSQVGLVQQAIESMTGNFLEQIPETHREFVASYISRFRELYLNTLIQQSSTLGIFAFSFLGWVGLKVYSNIDATLNHIWSSERKRPWMEKARNFVVVSAIAPLILIAGVSLPIVMKQVALRISFMGGLVPFFQFLSSVVPIFLIFVTLIGMYRYLPVERVKWRSAVWGALAATLALEVTNIILQVYFRFGTHSAYGKAAIIPLMGLWAYFVWLVIILGAEVSYLVSHGTDVLGPENWSPSWLECREISKMLAEALRAFQTGAGPLRASTLQSVSHLDSEKLKAVLDILIKKKMLVQCVEPSDPEEEYYGVARDLSQMQMDEILRGFFDFEPHSVQGQTGGLWEQSLDYWLQFFKDKKLNSI